MYIIPKVIYYTWKDNNFTKEIESIIEHNKKICPNYKFKFYDDKMCEKFIKKKFSKKVYKAYKNINPNYGAMRADFWRYCVIYRYGGIYLDIKIKLNTNLDNVIKPNYECILDKPNYIEMYRLFYNKPALEQWILIYRPKHPYLKKIITYLSNKINNNYLPKLSRLTIVSKTKQAILKITGPDMYSKIIISFVLKNKIIHDTIQFKSFAIYTQNNIKYKLYGKSKLTHYSKLTEPFYLKIDEKKFNEYIG